MTVKIRVSEPLRWVTQDQELVELPASTMGQCIEVLEARFPGLKERLLNEAGEVRSSIKLYRNMEDVGLLQGLGTPLHSGDEVSLVARRVKKAQLAGTAVHVHPGIEANMEMQWAVPDQGDPSHPLLPGRLYERLGACYPFHEPLPTAALPHPASKNVVQHRFRPKEGGWPLIGVGPGIVSLNETEGYMWKDFKQRAVELVESVFETYPQPETLRVTSLRLYYVTGAGFDYASEDLCAFLAEKERTRIALPFELFPGVPAVEKALAGLSFQAAFPVSNPRGTFALGLITGQHRGKPGLFRETAVRTADSDLPKLPEGIARWMECAHDIVEDWAWLIMEPERERKWAGDRYEGPGPQSWSPTPATA